MYLMSIMLPCQFKESLVQRARHAALPHSGIDANEMDVRLARTTGREKADQKRDKLSFEGFDEQARVREMDEEQPLEHSPALCPHARNAWQVPPCVKRGANVRIVRFGRWTNMESRKRVHIGLDHSTVLRGSVGLKRVRARQSLPIPNVQYVVRGRHRSEMALHRNQCRVVRHP